MSLEVLDQKRLMETVEKKPSAKKSSRSLEVVFASLEEELMRAMGDGNTFSE